MMGRIGFFRAIIAVFGVSLAGCVFITHFKELKLLKGFADEQAEIADYLNAQEKAYYQLKDDVMNNRLTQGLSYKDIVTRYGEPVLCESPGNEEKIKKSCRYQHPTDYLSTDKICLNFDPAQHLGSWKLIKAQE